MQTIYIKAKLDDKYLSDVLQEGLPKNCLFDKVTTGCGGTYLALTSKEPYIIAVPTRALVLDKVTSPSYSNCNVQGVSEDYPLAGRSFSTNDKIIVTYKSLQRLVSEGYVNPKDFNLLVDEVHMLTSMTGYAREELSWIMDNFKIFKSYCFMSATIPRREHLFEELRELTLYKMRWPDTIPVTFECYLSDNIQESILHILIQHRKGIRQGTPYFFYNSVTAICNIVKKWESQSEIKADFNIVCSSLDRNKEKLKKIKKELGRPNAKADAHFITATAFEGVDFYDPEGVTYIISDRSYATTKYSIETTIPQIVGRLRDSKYNDSVTVIFNKDNNIHSLSPREFSIYLDTKQNEAKYTLKIYNKLLKELSTERGVLASLKAQLSTLMQDPHILVEGKFSSFEDLVNTQDLEETSDFPKAEFYPYARVVAQQTYDLFHEERFVRGDQKGLGDPLSLGKLKGLAAGLTEEESKLFKLRQPTLKTLCNMYEKSPEDLKDKYEEWYQIIDKVGVEVCKSYSYKKLDIKKLYKAAMSIESETVDSQVVNLFKVGQWYSSKYIKSVLESLELDKPKATLLKQWFETEPRNMKHQAGYVIIRKL